ncbi:hypothetical protein ABPG77_008845 [Micractinium sp. CCAP 211/92]
MPALPRGRLPRQPAAALPCRRDISPPPSRGPCTPFMYDFAHCLLGLLVRASRPTAMYPRMSMPWFLLCSGFAHAPFGIHFRTHSAIFFHAACCSAMHASPLLASRPRCQMPPCSSAAALLNPPPTLITLSFRCMLAPAHQPVCYPLSFLNRTTARQLTCGPSGPAATSALSAVLEGAMVLWGA